MEGVKVEKQARQIPLAISIPIMCVVGSQFYVNLLLCEMSDPYEVFIAILVGIFSFTTQLGKRSKNKILGGSLASGLLFFLPGGWLRAACIGFFGSYLQTVGEVYTISLSLKSFRSDAVSLYNLLLTVLSASIFFALAFLPIKSVMDSFFFVIPVLCMQGVLVWFGVPAPPLEILKEKGNDSVLYDEVYKSLAALFHKAEFADFHQEYAELVDHDSGTRIPPKTRFWAVVEKVNVSFLSTALLGVLSTESSNSAYLVIFASTTMFSWLHANKMPERHVEMCVLMVSTLLLFVVLLYEVRPMFVIIMACSVYLVPSEDGYLSLDSYVIVVANAARSVLGAFLFAFMLRDKLV
ncbi:hypothetical protein NEHOM01_1473 [Nematocida homosporus]|uniref:uncharacterized protein n=1 Tax=Nematocida homosporus TaxID=1912981 RepID=UPI00221F31C7|nr:uncharacterized protein NEHOM01_1473 [Nematocida homosporus]KAI5186440.1 hypothetical protein NEHOM01_1473 [Nematocida homosporus]